MSTRHFGSSPLPWQLSVGKGLVLHHKALKLVPKPHNPPPPFHYFHPAHLRLTRLQRHCQLLFFSLLCCLLPQREHFSLFHSTQSSFLISRKVTYYCLIQHKKSTYIQTFILYSRHIMLCPVKKQYCMHLSVGN